MRKTEIVKITSGSAADNRDYGKQFLITEMPAAKAEMWAMRALMLLAKSDIDIPDDARKAGMQGLAIAGLKSLQKIDFTQAKPLLDEMWDCVRIIPDPKNNIEYSRPLVMNAAEGDDLEEVTTILLLREKIFRLHTDFFFKGKPSRKS